MTLDESAEQRDTIAHVAAFKTNGNVRECCRKPENLTREHQIEQRADLHVRLCRICGRRHFRLEAEPGRIGVILG